jgi:hypothetical protein
MIESYSFGRIVVDGTAYTSDLLILPDGTVESSWWRQRGHALTADDIAKLTACKPQLIVAGTGAYGLMKPERELAATLERSGIAFRHDRTKKAIEIFNEAAQDQAVAGCFHLTC